MAYLEMVHTLCSSRTAAQSHHPFCAVHRAALAPFLANVTASPNSYKWILYGDDDTFWFIDNALIYLSQLDPDMPYLLSDNIWMKERNSGNTALSSSAQSLQVLD